MYRDVVSRLVRDHRHVEKLFTQYGALAEASPGGRTSKRRADLFAKIRRELSVHAAVEEQVLYPEIANALPDGERLADAALQEHAGVKRALSDLESLTSGETRFETQMATLMSDVHHHVDEEEREILPKLPMHLSRKRLAELGEKLARAKALAPAHPHPYAPDRPPGNVLAGAVAGAIDRVRDALSGLVRPAPRRTPSRRRRPTAGGRRRPKRASTARAASRSRKRGAGGKRRLIKAARRKP